MLKHKKVLACVLVPLYLVTWVGGWLSHARQLRDESEVGYRVIERRNQEEAAWCEKTGDPCHPIQLHEGGPITQVYWCLPVLPGILLAESDSSKGPMCGRGGVKVVLYYGVGSTELCMLWGWIT